MKYKNAVCFFVFIVLSFLFYSCNNSTEPDEIIDSENTDNNNSIYVQELNKIITKVNGSSPELDNSDLQPLSFLGNATLVGLGEATHGTKEFFQLKHRMLKFLVEEYNFKIFGIEADMGESYYIDQYVTTGEGDITWIMKDKMHFWTWRTFEVRDLIEWMKDYNIGKSENDKIHYIGFDCQFVTYQAGLIVDYYQTYKPEFVDTVKEKLGFLLDESLVSSQTQTAFFDGMNQAEMDKIMADLDELLQIMTSQSQELISISSEYKYNLIKQLVRNAQQTVEVKFNYGHNVSSENYRDKYMAENSVWISSLFGTGTKAVLWAHNGHVSNDMFYGGGGSMGHRLKQQLADNYQIVGFSFSKGKFTAINQQSGSVTQNITVAPDSGSTNYIFYNAKFDNFILNFRDLSNETEHLSAWLNEEHGLLNIGAVFNGDPAPYYRIVELIEYFDVVINYDVTNYAVQL